MKKIIGLIIISVFAIVVVVAKTKDNTQATSEATSEEVVAADATKATTIKLTKEEFLKKVYNYTAEDNKWKYLGDKPAIIDFYADWCGPCQRTAPVLEELAAKYGDKLVIYKIDTDKEQELASVFNIQSLPSILFIPIDGEPQLAKGALPKDAFEEAIKSVLKVE